MLPKQCVRREDLIMGARYFGAEVQRGEDEALITGKGQYVDDIRLAGTLHGAFLRSPHAHAVIKAIDKSAAEKCRVLPQFSHMRI